jgi:hypothetical protein
MEQNATQIITHWYAVPFSTDEGGTDAGTEVIHASRARSIAFEMGLWVERAPDCPQLWH